MAESDERVPLTYEGDLYAMFSNYLPGSQETQNTESTYLESRSRIEGPSLQPAGQVAIQSALQQRSGNTLGSHGVMLNGPSAHGQHTNYGVEEEMPEPSRPRQGESPVADTAGDQPAREKRIRDSDWELDEKTILLVLKLKVLLTNKLYSLDQSTVNYDISWFAYASQLLGRAAKSCQRQYDSLLKHYKAIREHEYEIHSGTSSHVSFWKMTEEQKNRANEEIIANHDHKSNSKPHTLPGEFPWALYELVEIIDTLGAVKGNPGSRKKTKSIQVGPNLPLPPTPIAPTITDSNVLLRGLLGWLSEAIRSQPSSSHGHDSTIAPMLAMISNILASAQGSQGAEDKVSGMHVDELVSKIAPIVNKQIKDMVDPVISLLRIQEENNKQYREKRLALEETKLDLKRQKIQLRTRHTGVPSIANAGSVYPGAGVASNFEPSLPQAQPNASADQWRNINFDQASYDPGSGLIQYPNSNAGLFNNAIGAQLQAAGVADSAVPASVVPGQQPVYQMPATNQVERLLSNGAQGSFTGLRMQR